MKRRRWNGFGWLLSLVVLMIALGACGHPVNPSGQPVGLWNQVAWDAAIWE